MATTIDGCLAALLCPLGTSVTSAINTLIQGLITTLETQVAAIITQLLVIQPQLIAAQALQTVALAALNEYRSIGTLVPISIAAGCVPIGDLVMSIDQTAAASEAAVLRISASVNRKLSLKAELEAARDDANARIEAFRAISLVLSQCAGQRTGG